MPGTRPNNRPSITEQDRKQIAETRKTLAHSLKLLRGHPVPDTFFGRKTQEPFPQEPTEVSETDEPVS